ncbi:hypothetical protein GCM10009548_24710 [Streptomyces malaysiensis subsp. malaysiensis]
MIPGGSMITKRVRKRDPNTATSNTVNCLARDEYEDEERCRADAARERGAGAGRRRDGKSEEGRESAQPPVPGTGKAPVARRTISP